MPELFWQRTLTTIDYDALSAFIDERIQEGDHLEYKLPTYNKAKGGIFEFTDEFLETIVAFANAGGGLIICGVGEEKDDDGFTFPATIQGIRTMTEKGTVRNPEQVLRDRCASMIDPLVSLETHPIPIEDGEYAGNIVLLARIRGGVLPPYNLRLRRGQGIFIRNGDSDATAGVREIIALIGRSNTNAGRDKTPWERTRNETFTHLTAPNRQLPPIIMVALTPAFPIPPGPMNAGSDRSFENICLSLFGQEYYPVAKPDGIVYDIAPYKPDVPYAPFACAYADGSIGVHDSLDLTIRWSSDQSRPIPYEIDLAHLWHRIGFLLTWAQRWPRGACTYSGPLICRIAVGNIFETVGVVSDEWWARSTTIRPRQVASNRSNGWSIDTEWDHDVSVKDLLDRSLGPLARQLQFRHYDTFKDRILDAVGNYGIGPVRLGWV